MSIPVNAERVTQGKANLKMISDNDKNFDDHLSRSDLNPKELVAPIVAIHHTNYVLGIIYSNLKGANNLE